MAAFAIPAWVGAAFVLPLFIHDGAVRWAIATAAGLALAALAALWGHSFATAEAVAAREPASPREPGGVHNTVIDSTVHGPVMQGGDFSGPINLGDDPRGRPPS
jgi:2-hydroxychromene-2-carboxylate isomerase